MILSRGTAGPSCILGNVALVAPWKSAGRGEAREVVVEARLGWQEKGGQWMRSGSKGGLVWLERHPSTETGLEEDDP